MHLFFCRSLFLFFRHAPLSGAEPLPFFFRKGIRAKIFCESPHRVEACLIFFPSIGKAPVDNDTFVFSKISYLFVYVVMRSTGACLFLLPEKACNPVPRLHLSFYAICEPFSCLHICAAKVEQRIAVAGDIRPVVLIEVFKLRKRWQDDID